MAKKKGKKADAEKKAALQVKKEAKADKKAQKRLQKASATGEVRQDGVEAKSIPTASIDVLLQQYRLHDEKVTTTTVEAMESFPPPRSNASLTLYEDSKKKNAEVYMFGGEYFDGVENIVLDQLLKYDIQKQVWKRILTPITPPPRCAHSCVYYNHALYVFGGEHCVGDEYYHYKDVWRYDIRQQSWEEIKFSRVGAIPSARSGHAAVVWKHFMIIFGGFYEATKDAPRWFNDVTVMDLQTQQWLDIPHSKLTSRPEPRSACNFAVVGDDNMIIHGGFSKLSKTSMKLALNAGDNDPSTTETKVHTDAWILHLKPLLQGKPPTWERVTSSTARTQLDHAKNPCGRSGTASLAYKDRMLVFGGVVDKEQYDYKVDSVFYNDLQFFDYQRRNWYRVRTRPPAGRDDRRRRNAAGDGDEEIEEEVGRANQDEANDSDSELGDDDDKDNRHIDGIVGWDVRKLRSNMFAFLDGEGNIVYEKLKEDEAAEDVAAEEKSEDEEAKEEAKQGTSKFGRITSNHKSVGFQTLQESSIMILNPDTQASEAVKHAEPLPRIKATMFVAGSVLYIYGGLLEVGDREVTLDDFWSFDLRKREKWDCVYAGTMHKQVWRGAVNDDDDSYYSADRNVRNDDDETDSDAEDTVAEENESMQSTERESKSQNHVSQEFIELDEQYGIADMSRTPQAGESLADFYSRTSSYWNDQASNSASMISSDSLSAKEIKREGFALARKRYEELESIMDRLSKI